MSDARIKALEAVAEAARATVREVGGTDGLFEALAALAALPAAPPGDVVEVAVWEQPDGRMLLTRVGGRTDNRDNWAIGSTRRTTRLTLTKEAGDAN